jgi:hypothetical protein
MSSSTRSSGASSIHAALLAGLLLLPALGPVQAQVGGAAPASAAAMTLAPYVSRYVSDARLAGEGRLTWLGFHVYDAQLFAPARFSLDDPLRQPFVLELTYARKLEGKSIAAASRDEMQRMGLGTSEQQARWLARMEALFPDVDKGRRIAGVNQPGAGARFYVDGLFAGSVEEPEFARAFFAIWLDPRTRAPRLRESLLKGPGASL